MSEETQVAGVAKSLAADGWSPIPLPPREKSSPPAGLTGYSGKYVNASTVGHYEWTGNIAIRMPPDVVGVDVDVYHGGDASLKELEDEYGELPGTVWSTSREDGSGIALFRVPNGTTLSTNPKTGIDMIQAHHRYAIVWPSIHPEGRLYQWIDEQSHEHVDGPPEPGELPNLPWKWIEGLSVTKTEASAAATPIVVRDFIDNHGQRTFAAALGGLDRMLNETEGGRHDTLVEKACLALREAAAGFYPAEEAIDHLKSWWKRVMDDPVRRDGGEFGAAICWAVGQVVANPEEVAQIKASRVVDLGEFIDDGAPPTPPTPTGEIEQGDERNLPDEFWNARPSLRHIRQAAHARFRSADAVLLFTLARVSALISPTITLPPTVGSEASLNFLGGVVATSGAGKSTAGGVARKLVPIERSDVVADVPMGSGEGLIELYFEFVEEDQANGKAKKVKRQTKKSAFIYLDEGQALAEMGNRKGATLMPTLRAAWSGETLGQANATQETYRVLKDHSYRMSIMVGFQAEYAANLIADATGGTPQRFVFASARDPNVTMERPEWPGPLEIHLPPVYAQGQDFEIDPDIADQIQRRQVLQVTGKYEPDPLDSHRDLVTLKVAALLAFMDGRLNVSIEDWELAKQLMVTSCAVRSWVIGIARQKAAELEANRTRSTIVKERAMDGDRIERTVASGAKAVANKVRRIGGTVSRRDIHSAVSSRHRKVASMDEIIERAVAEGWIKPVGEGFRVGESRPS